MHNFSVGQVSSSHVAFSKVTLGAACPSAVNAAMVTDDVGNWRG